MQAGLNLRVGEWVEVRSKEEILATLDTGGQLASLPFMPEMFSFCGKRFQVYRRAHKTCDPVNGLGARGMADAVHLLGLRCDGSAHGHCQAGCLIYWKDAWLKRVDAPGGTEHQTVPRPRPSARRAGGCSEAEVVAATLAAENQPGELEPTYVCQATRISDATHPLRWWDPTHYVEDLTSGNIRLSRMFSTFLFWLCQTLADAGVGLGSAIRWAYDLFQSLRGGTPYPIRRGGILPGQPTPTARLDLQPGELVTVKSYPSVLETLNDEWRNRGLYFDPEMVPFCRGSFRVLRRVERIINEKTGKMLRFKNDVIILEGVECQA